MAPANSVQLVLGKRRSDSIWPLEFGLVCYIVDDGFGLLGFWGCNQAVGDEAPGKVGLAFPVVVSTWPFREAVRAAWEVVSAGGGSAVDAVVAGCSACEELRCDGTGQPLLSCTCTCRSSYDNRAGHNCSSRDR